ncbi:MAG: signal peptidase I [Actinobacteria bacterium]|nr:signal peptidase I [Actinomycetota bacterium]
MSEPHATAGDPVSTPSGREPAREDRGGSSLGAFFRELPVLLLVAFVLAFLLRTFVVQVFYIPSQSMEPTLQVNDRMVVEKISYLFREPRRGEIVVFEGERSSLPTEEETSARLLRGVGQFLGVVPANARDFVKRVIGLPGDTIRIEDGRVFVNDVPLEEPYVEFEDTKTQGPYEVPEGKLFFLGDNRPNSSDSRYTLGYVDADAVVGRAAVVIWPVEHIGGLGGADYEGIDEGSARSGDEAALVDDAS